LSIFKQKINTLIAIKIHQKYAILYPIFDEKIHKKIAIFLDKNVK
jgi:hypothetical protein